LEKNFDRNMSMFLLWLLLVINAVAFVTAHEPPESGDKVTFFAIGDFGFDNSGQRAVADVMNNLAGSGLDYVVTVGDNIYNEGVTSTSDPKWKSHWYDVYEGRCTDVPWYAVLGNHDWEGDPQAQVDYTHSGENRNKVWNMPSMSYNRTHTVGQSKVAWIHLDTNLIFYGPNGENQKMKSNFEKMGWTSTSAVDRYLFKVESMLKEAQGADWIFVVGHMINFGVICGHVGSMDKLVPMFEKYGVAAYFGGHTHALATSESNGIHYFLTGGGGQASGLCGGGKKDWALNSEGFLRGVLSESTLDVQYYNNRGTLLHTVSSITPRGNRL
jgi:predicted phosphodiesterase